MERRERFIVDGISTGKGVPSSGGYRDPDTGRMISQYVNPRPYYEPKRTPNVIPDRSQIHKAELKAQAWGFALDVAYDIWNMPEVRQARRSLCEYLVLEFDSWLWRKREEKEARRALDAKNMAANFKEVQLEEPSRDETLVKEVKRLKQEGKIVDFPSKKVV